MKSILKKEINSVEQLSYEKFLIPNVFKKVGILLAIGSFILMVVNLFSFDSFDIRSMSKYGMLFGMFLIAIAKEPFEDELSSKLRMQSFTLAFIVGVIFSLMHPYLNYVMDLIFTGDKAVMKENGDFLILWILLGVKVFYFESLKKVYQ